MAKTFVAVDRGIAAQAAEILGTATLSETIDASLREIVNVKLRLELVEILSEPDRFGFAAAEHAWGGQH
ncbi:hypothetical protein [Candidatus Poriferisodalis sp.]|uniref:hypothetical protein n=1 Tax=Candidatus Poriferisodalis sp. TaxID=3101277 RepID=UPI003AF936D1